MPRNVFMLTVAFWSIGFAASQAEHPNRAPGVTSLTNRKVQFQKTDEHFVTLKRGSTVAVIVDNAEVDQGPLSKHRAGYNGVASLTHSNHKTNLFVPSIAGLNFEHIHDGTTAVLTKCTTTPRESKERLDLLR